MSGVIDAHTHCYSEEVISNPMAWAKERSEHYWASLVGPRADGAPSLQGWADRQDMLASMDAAGIEKSILLGWYWEHGSTCLEQNRWHEAWVKENPDRFIAFSSIHPSLGSRAIDELNRCYDLGFKGIGEVSPAAQGFDMKDKGWCKIVEWAITHKFPINMHVTEPVGTKHSGSKGNAFSEYQWLFESYPEATFILAHLGGLMAMHEMNPYFKKIAKNVYYDMAATPLLYDSRIYKSIVEVVGAKKVLFGSDYPLKIYPKLTEDIGLQKMLKDVESSGINKEDLDLILRGNAIRL